jgi:hypothetical protein
MEFKQMKRISVMANDPLLVDAIASMLALEIGPDVLQLTYRLPGDAYQTLRNHRSMMIVIDEGDSEIVFSQAPHSYSDSPMLLIKAVLRTIDIDIDKSYQMIDPDVNQLTRLVRDFRGTYLGRIDEEVMTWAA